MTSDTTEARAARVAGELTMAQREALLTGTFVVSGQASYRNGKVAMSAHGKVLYNLRCKGLLRDHIGTPLLSELGLATRKHLENDR